MFDAADLHTETFTNSQGWTLVRVTHLPTGAIAERARSTALESSVQAHTQCIEELRERVPRADSDRAASDNDSAVSREEFEALTRRVADLERRLR